MLEYKYKMRPCYKFKINVHICECYEENESTGESKLVSKECPILDGHDPKRRCDGYDPPGCLCSWASRSYSK